MHEPTQTRMVAAVRCRVRGVLAEVTQVLGLQCASILGIFAQPLELVH
jgi:hypothetical protein